MRYIVGLDGGGTKTAALLCDEEGREIRRVTGPATNPNGQPLEQAKARFQDVLRRAAEGYEIASVFAGVAGTGAADMRARYDQWAREVFPEPTMVKTGSDVVCTITAAIGFEDGIAAIAGTGSSAFVRVDGRYTQVGGWGYFFEDAGSGFELGRQALIHWMRTSDGRSAPSALSQLCREKAGGEALSVLSSIYAGGRTVIAGYAPCVFQALAAGDPAAQAIVERQAELYVELLATGGRLLPRAPYRVALGGSIWKQDVFRQAVERRLGSDFELVLPTAEPVSGAIQQALRMLESDGGLD